jgi:hypothetical protein
VALAIAGVCLLYPNEVIELIDQAFQWGESRS